MKRAKGYPWDPAGDASPTPESLEKLEGAAVKAFKLLLEAVPEEAKGPGTEIDGALALYGAAFFGAKGAVARLELLRDGTSEVFRELSEEAWAYMLQEKAERAMASLGPKARAAFPRSAAKT